MKKVFIPLALVTIFIVLLGIFLQKYASLIPSIVKIPQSSTTNTTKTTIKIADKTINVTLAISDAERQKGLSEISSLDENSGMLFIFTDKSRTPTFWMKGMLIPLDMIWINDGSVIKIDKNIPAPPENTTDANLQTYTAGIPVDYVLEVNSGFTDKNSIKVGDKVSVSGI